MTANRHRDSFREQDVHQKSPPKFSNQLHTISLVSYASTQTPIVVMLPGSVAVRGATELRPING